MMVNWLGDVLYRSRVITFCVVGLLALVILPFGSTGVKVAKWARDKQ